MRYKRQLEVRHYNIKQEIDSFILPPNTWYRDIGGKYSHVEIIVGLQSQYHLEKNEIIEVDISCHYGSGYHEEISSDKPLYTILENLSRLKIDDSGSAIICLRFEQLSTRHSNEKFVIRISAKGRSDIESINAPPISVLSKPSETSRQRQNLAGILDSFKFKTGKRTHILHDYPNKRSREDSLHTSYIYSDPTSLYHHHPHHSHYFHHPHLNNNNSNNNNTNHTNHNDDTLLKLKSFHEINTIPNSDESSPNLKIQGINDTTSPLDPSQTQVSSYKTDTSNPSPSLATSPLMNTVFNGDTNPDLQINLNAIPKLEMTSSISPTMPYPIMTSLTSIKSSHSYSSDDNHNNNDVNNINNVDKNNQYNSYNHNNHNHNHNSSNFLSSSCLLLQQESIVNSEDVFEIIETLPAIVSNKILQIQKLLKSLQWPINNYIRKRDGSLIPHHLPIHPNSIIDEIHRLSNDVHEVMKHSRTISPMRSRLGHHLSSNSSRSPTSVASPPSSTINLTATLPPLPPPPTLLLSSSSSTSSITSPIFVSTSSSLSPKLLPQSNSPTLPFLSESNISSECNLNQVDNEVKQE